MLHWIELAVTVFASVIASSGFWTWLQSKNEKKDHKTQMLMGLGHDRILYLGMKYLERGDWITSDEFENLVDWLYKPYASLGGNGSAEKVVTAVKDQLRIVENPPVKEEHND